jgi:hypothetical protein
MLDNIMSTRKQMFTGFHMRFMLERYRKTPFIPPAEYRAPAAT